MRRFGPRSSAFFDTNWQVYGVRKIWQHLRREGFDVARCTVARLMKSMGIQGGIIRGKPQKTTVPDKKLPCPLDKVNRQFRVPAPNMLWVSDFTYVATWKGVSAVLLPPFVFPPDLRSARSMKNERDFLHGHSEGGSHFSAEVASAAAGLAG